MKNFQNKAKIAKMSKVIRNILFAGLVLWLIDIPLMLFRTIALWNTTTLSAEHYMRCTLTLSLEFILGITFIVNLKLFRFFDQLKDGRLFDATTVNNLGAAGKWWIVLWLFHVLHCEMRRGIFQISDDWNSERLADWNFGSLFAGLVLIFVAWLLKEAQEIQEEQELTV
jgi:hypothetical protein